MENCIFCKILAGEIPSKKVYEDELVYAFEDIAPAAPLHWLFIPKTHVNSLASLEDSAVAAALIAAINRAAAAAGIDDYRVVINNGEAAGQTVFHLHAHLLAGRRLGTMG